MGTPQIIFIILATLAGGIVLSRHGEPRDNYNFGIWFLSMSIEVGLLYWGGFFG